MRIWSSTTTTRIELELQIQIILLIILNYSYLPMVKPFRFVENFDFNLDKSVFRYSVNSALLFVVSLNMYNNWV